MKFTIECPNNHPQTVRFDRDQFEAELKSGALIFHCNTCDANWPPTREELTEIRKRFQHEPE